MVESYRPEGVETPRTRVLVHLGVHPTPEAALAAWPSEVEHVRGIGRDEQADRLEAKLERLRGLTTRGENDAG